MQACGSLPPIYLVHHLLGDIMVYRAMAECFAPDRPVYGLQAPADFQTRLHPYSLSALAAEYNKEILQHRPNGPYHLAGYSSGSVLAFEMARQLEMAGHQVGLLALIDGDINASEPAVPFAQKCFQVAARKLYKVAFKFRDEVSYGPRHFLMSRIGYLKFLWKMKRLQEAPASVGSEITLEQALSLSERTYRPQAYAGSALLIRFKDEAWRFGPNPLMGWGALLDHGVEAIDLPGGHITGMNPNRASRIAEVLRSRMETLESTLEQNREYLAATAL